MPERTIKSIYFGYVNANGTFVTARKGETVDIPEGRYLTRGDQLGAFVTDDDTPATIDPLAAEPPVIDPLYPSGVMTGEHGPELTSLPEGATIDSPTTRTIEPLDGNVGQVLAYAEDHKDEAADLLAREQAKGDDARKGVVEGLTKLLEA
ncbi:hypothetical protein GTQ99_00240 [Kineococcus sp. T13]|uniref:hypothetical protein n=1 Tax=Kineococcus vitellinus TaxID=2696565 RepID=UPI0014128BC6|nr:hypothetical protein [Kineococcus vitellinus]NAZ73859.1 hypothetical protein [Kineococcus vitellinus]